MLPHRVTVIREFFDVVHQAIQLPLTIHLGLSAQDKSIESFVAAKISEHGLHGGEATGDHWKRDRNVNSQAVGSAEATLKYLTPYVFRVAISDHRIVNIDDDNQQVTFWYRHKESQRQRTLTLNTMEFMRRFLQHVLPAGFMKIRYYGFLSPTSSVTLDTIRTLIELAHGFEIATPIAQAPAMTPMKCPHCGGTLHYGGFTPPRQRITTMTENRPPTILIT